MHNTPRIPAPQTPPPPLLSTPPHPLQAAAELSSVVKGLVGMSPKQLAAVSHLLTEEQLQEIGLAARLPRVNQVTHVHV